MEQQNEFKSQNRLSSKWRNPNMLHFNSRAHAKIQKSSFYPIIWLLHASRLQPLTNSFIQLPDFIRCSSHHNTGTRCPSTLRRIHRIVTTGTGRRIGQNSPIAANSTSSSSHLSIFKQPQKYCHKSYFSVSSSLNSHSLT